VTCLWSRSQATKTTKSLKQDTLINHVVQISNKQLSANIQRLLLVCRSLVDTNGLAPQANLVHDFGSIVGIFLANKLDKTKALVSLGNAIFGKVDVDNATGLQHQFPDQLVGHALVEVADVDGGLLVLFPVFSSGRHGCELERVCECM
jgi:hypothetical protein